MKTLNSEGATFISNLVVQELNFPFAFLYTHAYISQALMYKFLVKLRKNKQKRDIQIKLLNNRLKHLKFRLKSD